MHKNSHNSLVSLHRLALLACLLGLAAAGGPVSAQPARTALSQTVTAVVQALESNYVFPDVAARAGQELRRQLKRGAYDTLGGEALALRLTRDLQRISGDLHLGISYHPEVLPAETASDGPPSEADIAWMKQLLAENGYGIPDRRMLPGGVGYLNITLFGPLSLCADSMAAAVQSVAEAKALIIDLRACRGSIDPHAIPFLSGYFFADPVHLNDFYDRLSGQTTQTWSYAWVPGKRMTDIPVWILTSGRTFSGGEEFAYDFQQLKRATLVGEQTGGGANPGRSFRLGDHYSAFIPTGRAINPLTGTNWEGVGVQPDSAVRSDLALYRAQRMALRHLRQREQDLQQQAVLDAAIEALEAGAPRLRQHTFTLAGMPHAKSVYVAGSFNFWASEAIPLRKTPAGWSAQVELMPGSHTYRFIVDGAWMTDPANPVTKEEGGHRNSVLELP